MTEHVATNETILVVGGGISGMTAALEAAESGKKVVLVEKNPALGGRTAQLYRYFPKLCHPTCGLEINLRRLKGNPSVRVLTLAEVTGIDGSAGNYTATLKIKPRYVNENCTACGDCARAVETKVDDPFNYDLGQHKAAYLPHAMAYPQRYVLDPSIIGTRRRRQGEGGLQVRRDRPRHAGRDDPGQGRRGGLGDRLAALRRGEDPALRLRPLHERHHQRRIRAPGRPARPDRRQDPAPLRRQGSEEHRLHPVRRLARREPSAPLLAHLLHGVAEADALRARGISAKTASRPSTTSTSAPSTASRISTRRCRPIRSVSFIKSKVAKITEDEQRQPGVHGVDTEGYNRYATPHDLVVLAVGMEPSVKGINIPGRHRRRFERLHRSRPGQRRRCSAPAARRTRWT